MPKAKLNDISFYYEVYGIGFPLLLIGGLGSDSSSWLGVVKELSLSFRVIVFDNRGCGRSDIAPGSSIRDMAEDAVKLLDFLKIEKAHILGHSMGGYIAQELAINYPERVNKLILESTAPVSSERNNALFEGIYSQLKNKGYSEDWFKNWTGWLFSPGLAADKYFVGTFIKNSVKYPYLQKPEGFKSQMEAIALFDARDRIKLIKAKTLVLEGENDILITPEEAKNLAENIPGSVFRLLDGAAHCIHIENPKLFTADVSRFLKKN
jgi:pimeloyl-ACP methyl ester carboxylesterase